MKSLLRDKFDLETLEPEVPDNDLDLTIIFLSQSCGDYLCNLFVSSDLESSQRQVQVFEWDWAICRTDVRQLNQ